MKYVMPDYENCGLNVISSIMHHYGLKCSQRTMPDVDALLKKNYRNILFMLFDGMGMDVLKRFLPEDSYLRKSVNKVMTAVYPSTTTNVTSSYETGLSPKEHAWLGWTLYFNEIGKAVDLFTNRSEGEEAADYPVAWRYIPKVSLFEKMEPLEDVEAFSVSAFSEDYYAETLDDLFRMTQELCNGEKRRYIYTYWNEPDHTMHGYGCSTEKLGEILREIGQGVQTLADSVGDDTLILVTADHGLIDARHHYLDEHPRIEAMLEHVPTIETRAATFHVKPEFKSAFPAVFREEYGDNFLLLDRDLFIAQFLGNGREHPKLRDFIGDYVALAIDHDCIDNKRSDFELKGVHAGLTEQEMLVPLIIAKS